MDESKRYNEPKKLEDILKDMEMDEHSLHKKRKSQEAGEKCAADIMKMMRVHKKLMKQLDIIYQKTIPLINKMDAYYVSERKSLLQAKCLVAEGKLTQQDINKRMQIIMKNLDRFEAEHADINTSLRKVIKKFPHTNDQQEQNKKANELYNLFIDIYTDIENILVRYSELLSKAPKR